MKKQNVLRIAIIFIAAVLAAIGLYSAANTANPGLAEHSLEIFESTNARGIDVSHYQGTINWPEVGADSQNISFVMIKATDGDSYVDTHFDLNWSGARSQYMLRGAYHFFRPLDDPTEQAQLFIDQIKYTYHSTDLPLVVDIEMYPDYLRDQYLSLTLSQRINRLNTFLAVVYQGTGKLPIIYTNQYSWQTLYENTEDFTEYPLWIANYGTGSPNLPANNWGGEGWLFWQYTNTGAVEGINGGEPPVDLDWFNGTVTTLRNLTGFSLDRSLPPYITNAAMVEGFRQAAAYVGTTKDALINKAGINYIQVPEENLGRMYDGPPLDELPISNDEYEALSAALIEVVAEMQYSNLLFNQDMITAVYEAAHDLSMSGYVLLSAGSLEYLLLQPEAIYKGPSPENISGWSTTQADAVQAVLDGDQPAPGPTYAGITNQDMINIFYDAADALGEDGWHLVEEAGLEWLADDRTSLYYGPLIEEMTGLTSGEKAAMLIALNNY